MLRSRCSGWLSRSVGRGTQRPPPIFASCFDRRELPGVSYGGGIDPQWSADKKELYYLTPDWKLMAVDITTSNGFQAATPHLLFQVPQGLGVTAGGYTVDGRRFLFRVPMNNRVPAPFTVVLNWPAALNK